jgi:hypothetical protein
MAALLLVLDRTTSSMAVSTLSACVRAERAIAARLWEKWPSAPEPRTQPRQRLYGISDSGFAPIRAYNILQEYRRRQPFNQRIHFKIGAARGYPHDVFLKSPSGIGAISPLATSI